jgi:tetratricopeptide (TPR) repeat protein
VSLDYTNAIEMYNQCLARRPKDKELKKTVYSNRAQAFLKLKNFEDAERDATMALKFDPTHIKSLNRRGQARFYLKKYKEAKKDFYAILKVEPTNSGTIEFTNKTNSKIDQFKNEAYDRMRRKILFEQAPKEHRIRVHIEEINLDEKIKIEMETKKEEVVIR